MKVISAHAPHDADNEENKNEFWDSLASLVESVFTDPSATQALLIDANARCAPTPDLAIGPFDADKPNDNI